MLTIHRYVGGSYLLSFVTTLVVFTFILSIRFMFRVAELLAAGVDWAPLARILLYSFPETLAMSVPISALTAALLVFGRLSSDGEIAAMTTGGINIWRVAAIPLGIAALLTVFCVYINSETVPRGHLVRRREVAALGVGSVTKLLQAGRFIQDFPGLTIYIGRKSGDRLSDVRIYDLRRPNVRREIRARSGELHYDEGSSDLLIDLRDVRVDPFHVDRPGQAFCKRWPIRIENAVRQSAYRPRAQDQTFRQLLDDIRYTATRYPELSTEDVAVKRSLLSVELHKRLVFSFACLSFVLLGIPLGIKGHRKDSSIGVAISLFLVLNFYVFIIVAQSMAKYPSVHPDVIVWLPVIISVLIGTRLIQRAN